MAEYSFRKTEILRKRSEFQKVLDNGQKKRAGSIGAVFRLHNDLGWKRWGIIASKKIGNAVVRNRAKRRLREVFRRNKYKIKPAWDIVVIAGKGSVDLPFLVLEQKIVQALQA